ncbi:MAG TPA: chromosomal replication initiator protein DnaA [Chloroflexota bacterium]|nr:chromosomal replication initiator protein DnaA [Chloroflexota bacterium]
MEAQTVWRSVLSSLQETMPPANFDTWLRPTRAIECSENVLVVGVPTTYGREWLEQRLSTVIRHTLGQIGRGELDLRFQVMSELAEVNGRRGRRLGAAALGQLFTGQSEFNPRYTFADFIEGPSNRFAYNAALAAARSPGQTYNPLFIYGGVGLGKTHLLHAIGHAVKREFVDYRVVYATSERFINELIRAIREGSTEEFREHYRDVDVLLIDDIQFLGGKESTQEEFFHTFNALHDSGRQIVISSDNRPKALNPLEDRLRSRFEWGLIADIQPPELETRIAILRSKAEKQDLPVPPDVVQYLARRVPSNIRELEGSLNRIIAYASLNERQLSVDLAAAALDSLSGPRRAQVTPRSIIDCVAKHYGVSLDDLRGKSRDKSIVVPRQVAMYLVREETNASLEQIGQLLGGRDHTTVMHGWDKMTTAVQDDHQLRNDVLAVRSMMYGSE